MFPNTNFLFIEPFGKFYGHFSSFTKNLIDGSYLYNTNIDLLTFNGLYEDPEYSIRHFQILNFIPPIILRPILKFLTKEVELTIINNILCSLLCLLYSLILYRRFKYSGIFFLDGYIPVSLLASFFVPIGVEIHNVSFITSEPFRNRFLSRVFKAIFYKLISMNNSTFFAAPNVYQNLPQWFLQSAPTSIAPWGIAEASKSPEHFQKSDQITEKDSTVKLLYFGINHNSKDYETAFSALNVLSQRQENRKFRLVIAGPLLPLEKNDPYILQQKYNLLNLEIINKYLEDNEIEKLFLESDYLIVAYVPQFEGTSSIIDFALMYNIPIITSNSGDLYQRVENDKIGFVFNAGDSSDLVNILKLLPLPHSDAYLQLKAKIRHIYQKQIQNRSWLKSAHLRLEILEKFCSSKRL